jgi:hypothetical protein
VTGPAANRRVTCSCDGKHSTGQAYKGGPNSSVFLQITAEPNFDLAIPGRKTSFGVIEAAQARGDFRALAERSRRASTRISRMTRLRVLPQSAKWHGWRWRDRCRRRGTDPVAVSSVRNAPDKPLRAGK